MTQPVCSKAWLILSALAASTLVVVLIKASSFSCCSALRSPFLRAHVHVVFEDAGVPLEGRCSVSS
jgi:hypothetical protein